MLKNRTANLFILVLVMPLVILAWLGQRSLAQDRIVAEHQAQALAESRLREAQTLVHSFIRDLRQRSVTALSSLKVTEAVSDNDIQMIRAIVNADPLLEQVFVLSADRVVQFPQDSDTYSNSERAFFTMLTVLLEDDNVFRRRPAQESDVTPGIKSGDDQSSSSRIPKVSKVRSATGYFDERQTYTDNQQGQPNVGWTNWDAGTTTDTYLWYQDENGTLLGQKLSSAYWLSQLIAALPSTNEGVGLTDASIRLVTKRQRVIYQWGDFQRPADERAVPVASNWLAYPLEGWRLEYYAPQTSLNTTNTLIFILSFLTIALLVLIGGWVMWREYRRDVHEAEQRVSFVNQVSHELKTPLTNICIYADMLETEVMQGESHDQQRVAKFTKVVTSESKRLGRLINNVLNFSRTQQHKMTVHKHSACVDEVIRTTLEHFTPAFESKNIIVERTLNNNILVMLDAELLEQVLNNLLSNIEKYAAEGGLAKVTSEIKGTLTSITVTDAGPGISQALSAKVFEPFERGSDAITEGVSGTGIGLAIARDLCRLHGGDLQLIDSRRGASFQLTLRTEAVI